MHAMNIHDVKVSRSPTGAQINNQDLREVNGTSYINVWDAVVVAICPWLMFSAQVLIDIVSSVFIISIIVGQVIVQHKSDVIR